jgi:DNA-binding CsgD family transcriptional regulator
MGRLQWSSELVDEANSICNAIGIRERPYAALMLAAWRGDAAALSSLIEEAREHALVRHEGGMLTYCEVASSVLHNGLGSCDRALEAARSAAADDQPGFGIVLTELVEAAMRSGHADAGSVVLERLVEQTGATPGFAAGMRTRCQALLAEDNRADELFGESVRSLEDAPALAQLARTHLLWGEALRRQGQRLEAREHLRIAHGILREIGAAGFADRAHQELQATGERVRPRSDTARDELTAQERRIARLARDGMSNPEIASYLFISRRTVEYHLHNVFAKLGIRSRVQIGDAWPDDSGGEASASGATPSLEPAGHRT